MFIQGSTGNVGIGTSSPSSKLEVSGGDIEINDAQATGSYKIKGLRVFYKGNDTLVSSTSSTPPGELKKQFIAVFNETHGIKPRYVNVLARIWNNNGLGVTSLNVTIEGCNGILLTTTGTTQTLVAGSISVDTCTNNVYQIKVYLLAFPSTTAYNDLLELYYVE
jgi:hypothetical protein